MKYIKQVSQGGTNRITRTLHLSQNPIINSYVRFSTWNLPKECAGFRVEFIIKDYRLTLGVNLCRRLLIEFTLKKRVYLKEILESAKLIKWK